MVLEALVVQQEFTTIDLLLWRRFGIQVDGMVEKVLAANPGAADTIFLPVGTRIMVDPTDFTLAPTTVRKVVRLWN